MSTDKTGGPPNMNIKLNSRLVAAVAQFRAIADIRYYLCGVYAEPIATGGALLVATNGHAMCLWRDKDGVVDRPVILRTERKLLAACAGKDAKHLILVGDRLTVTDRKNNELFVQPNDRKWEIEATYPDWQRVIPEAKEEGTLFDALNPNLVSYVAQALKTGTGSKKFSGITFNQPKPNGPIIVTSNSIEGENFMAVIMPLRESVSRQPKWVQELRSATETTALPNQQPSDAAPAEGGAT